MKINKTLNFILQLIFSVVVLWWLTHKLGARDIMSTFARMSLPVIAGCVLLYLVAQILSSWRWAVISRMFGFRGHFVKYNSIYFLGMFYNLFLPTGYGGDVVKVLYQAPDRSSPSKTLAALTILLDRFMGFIALLLIGGLASWGVTKELGPAGAIMSWGLVVCVILGFAFLRPLSYWSRLPRKIRFIFLTLRAKGFRLVPVALISLIIQLLNVAIYAWLFHSLGADISFLGVCVGYSLVTIATLLPISVGGLGVRESGWAALMLPFGRIPEVGVTAGLMYFFVQTLCSLFGLVPFFSFKHEKNYRRSQKP